MPDLTKREKELNKKKEMEWLYSDDDAANEKWESSCPLLETGYKANLALHLVCYKQVDVHVNAQVN